MTYSVPHNHVKQILKNVESEKLKAGLVKYLQNHFKLKNGAVQDVGIETGGCYNLNLDLSEVCEDELEGIAVAPLDN